MGEEEEDESPIGCSESQRGERGDGRGDDDAPRPRNKPSHPQRRGTHNAALRHGLRSRCPIAPVPGKCLAPPPRYKYMVTK